jgi:hypothetical protein
MDKAPSQGAGRVTRLKAGVQLPDKRRRDLTQVVSLDTWTVIYDATRPDLIRLNRRQSGHRLLIDYFPASGHGVT